MMRNKGASAPTLLNKPLGAASAVRVTTGRRQGADAPAPCTPHSAGPAHREPSLLRRRPTGSQAISGVDSGAPGSKLSIGTEAPRAPGTDVVGVGKRERQHLIIREAEMRLGQPELSSAGLASSPWAGRPRSPAASRRCPGELELSSAGLASSPRAGRPKSPPASQLRHY